MLSLLIALALVLGSVHAQGEFDSASNSFKYEFRNGSGFWIPIFSDYNVGTLEQGLFAALRPLPSNLTLDSPESDSSSGEALTGLSWKLESENLSNGTFMGLKKKLNISQAGIALGSNYSVTIRVWFASDTASNCTRLGGDPAAVDVKAGVFHEEPTVIHAADDYWMLAADQVPCSSVNETNTTVPENNTHSSNGSSNGCVCNFLCVVGEQCCCLESGPVCTANGVCPENAIGYSSLASTAEQSTTDVAGTDAAGEDSSSDTSPSSASDTSSVTDSSGIADSSLMGVTSANAIASFPPSQLVPCSAIGKACNLFCVRGKQCCCNAKTGAVTCVPIGSCPTKACGNKYCKATENCCIPSCGGVCITGKFCPLFACTPTCGNTRCASNQKCCSACGGTVKRCVPKAAACPLVFCPIHIKCGNTFCKFGEQCCPLCPGSPPKCFSNKFACPKVFCPVGVKCGNKFCTAGQKCCSAACSRCAPLNALCAICPIITAASRVSQRLAISRATAPTGSGSDNNGTDLCVSDDQRGTGDVIGDISVQTASCNSSSNVTSTDQSSGGYSATASSTDNQSSCPGTSSSSWFVKRIEHQFSSSYAYNNETGSDLWVLIGTKSRYAGRTTIYWMHVEVEITAADSGVAA